MSASPQPPDRPAPVARVLASRRAGLPPAVPLTPRLPAPLARLVPRLCDPSWLGFPGATDIDFRPILPVLGLPVIQLATPAGRAPTPATSTTWSARSSTAC